MISTLELYDLYTGVIVLVHAPVSVDAFSRKTCSGTNLRKVVIKLQVP